MAKAQTGAAKPQAKATAKPAAGKEPTMLPGIFVRSFSEVFRRAGHVFTREGHGLLLENLTEEQLKAIREEPMLSVQECEFPAAAEDDEQLQQDETGANPGANGGTTEPQAGGNA